MTDHLWHFYRSFVSLVWSWSDWICGLIPIRLSLWYTTCSTYSSCMRKQAKTWSKMLQLTLFCWQSQCKFSFCLIAALPSSSAVRFPDPGMPVFFIMTTIQTKFGNYPFGGQSYQSKPAIVIIWASVLSPGPFGVNPPFLVLFDSCYLLHSKSCKTCQSSSTLSLGKSRSQ